MGSEDFEEWDSLGGAVFGVLGGFVGVEVGGYEECAPYQPISLLFFVIL
jgi:hypothetical protein